MTQMRWAIVPACVTFGPLFFVMGIAGAPYYALLGAIMTVTGLSILIHGITTRQLPKGSPPSREYLSGVVTGFGFGFLLVPQFVHEFSTEWLMCVGCAILIAGSFLRPGVLKASQPLIGSD